MRRKIPLRCWIRIRIWEYKDREPFDGGCKAGLTCDGHCRNCPAFSMSKFCLRFGRAFDEGLQEGIKETLGIQSPSAQMYKEVDDSIGDFYKSLNGEIDPSWPSWIKKYLTWLDASFEPIHKAIEEGMLDGNEGSQTDGKD